MMHRLVGFIAAVASAISFGSFAVPIKTRRVLEAKVHPIIFQTYKSLACFAVSWVLLFWTDFHISWYGVLPAAIWIQTGVMAIVAIHLAGLGVAQAVWSGVSIAISFGFGKLLFHEPMSNVPLAVTGLLLMIVGMGGIGIVASKYGTHGEAKDIEREGETGMIALTKQESDADPNGQQNHMAKTGDNPRLSDETEVLVAQEGLEVGSQGTESAPSSWQDHSFGLGVLVAIWVGLSAASMMICLKMAPEDCQGDQYVLSFGFGVGLVMVVVDAVLFAVCHFIDRDPPAMHFAVVCGPASLAGFLWGLGHYLSVIAIDELGIAVGYPIVQCNLILSSMWALFYYKEISGREAIIWFLSSTGVILAGVTLLAVFGL